MTARDNTAFVSTTALRLARYVGSDAQSWLNLQIAYDLKQAQKELAPKKSKEVMPLAA